jgi:hypothetical protein
MTTTVLIELTYAGGDTGPFNLYSNLDGFVTPFETDVEKSALEAGYISILVPEGTTFIRVMSNNPFCTNFQDFEIDGPPITSTTTTTEEGDPYSYYIGEFKDCEFGCGSGSTVGTIRSLSSGLVIGRWYEVEGGGVFEITNTSFSDSYTHTATHPPVEYNTCAEACDEETTTTSSGLVLVYRSLSTIDGCLLGLEDIDITVYIDGPNLSSASFMYEDVGGTTPVAAGSYAAYDGTKYEITIGIGGSIDSITAC